MDKLSKSEELLAKIKPEFWHKNPVKCLECEDTGYLLSTKRVNNGECVYSRPCDNCEGGRAIKLDPKAKWASNLPAKTRTAMKRLGKLA